METFQARNINLEKTIRGKKSVALKERPTLDCGKTSGTYPTYMYHSSSHAHYRKRGSASYIVREVLSVREREREREIQTERERERQRETEVTSPLSR